MTAYTIPIEVGSDLFRLRNASSFASRLLKKHNEWAGQHVAHK
jgi:hypothetical protein